MIIRKKIITLFVYLFFGMFFSAYAETIPEPEPTWFRDVTNNIFIQQSPVEGYLEECVYRRDARGKIVKRCTPFSEQEVSSEKFITTPEKSYAAVLLLSCLIGTTIFTYLVPSGISTYFPDSTVNKLLQYTLLGQIAPNFTIASSIKYTGSLINTSITPLLLAVLAKPPQERILKRIPPDKRDRYKIPPH